MSNPGPHLVRLLRATVSVAVVGILHACGGGVSPYEGVGPDQLFAVATDEFENGDHDNAIEVLDRILAVHGDWPRVPEARLMLGDVYAEKGDLLTARAEYTRFLDRYAGHPSSAMASLGICSSLAELAPKPERDQGYTQEAMVSCRNVITDFPGTEQAIQAAEISNSLRHILAEKEYSNGDYYFRRRLYDAAIKYYEFVVNLYPESAFAAEALWGMCLSNNAIGYDDLAEDAIEQLVRDYPDSNAASMVTADGSCI